MAYVYLRYQDFAILAHQHSIDSYRRDFSAFAELIFEGLICIEYHRTHPFPGASLDGIEAAHFQTARLRQNLRRYPLPVHAISLGIHFPFRRGNPRTHS